MPRGHSASGNHTTDALTTSQDVSIMISTGFHTCEQALAHLLTLENQSEHMIKKIITKLQEVESGTDASRSTHKAHMLHKGSTHEMTPDDHDLYESQKQAREAIEDPITKFRKKRILELETEIEICIKGLLNFQTSQKEISTELTHSRGENVTFANSLLSQIKASGIAELDLQRHYKEQTDMNEKLRVAARAFISKAAALQHTTELLHLSELLNSTRPSHESHVTRVSKFQK